MNILILGRGKTGSLVAEIAHERRHKVRVLGSTENPGGSAITADGLRDITVVIDLTTPDAVTRNIEACLRAGKDMVVGTTGWHNELPRIRQMVEDAGTAFLYGSNFSIGVNLFFDMARTGATALEHRYMGQIFERHHAQKKDAPSGTAVTLQKVIRESSGADLEIVSFREGDVVGMHEVVLDSPNDTIYLCHDSKTRRGFADGAIRAAEWLVGKKGFFDFKDVWREL
jgi:4-hydroxy-tetrahydrodipicolinate reductase